jgi:hypothetical protein
VKEWQHTKDRLAGLALEPGEPGGEQGALAAESIDHDPHHALAFRFGEAFQCTHHVGERAAAVDVGDQQHGAVDRFGEAHVGDVARAQVHLRRAARTLDDHGLETAAQALESGDDLAKQPRLRLLVGARLHIRKRLAADDDLRAAVARGLEQHRVHVGKRRDARRLRLQRLRARDFAAVGGDCAVERHVLRLERGDLSSSARENATQARDERALARTRAGTLDHERTACSVESFNGFHSRLAPARLRGGQCSGVGGR